MCLEFRTQALAIHRDRPKDAQELFRPLKHGCNLRIPVDLNDRAYNDLLLLVQRRPLDTCGALFPIYQLSPKFCACTSMKRSNRLHLQSMPSSMKSSTGTYQGGVRFRDKSP